MTTESESRKEKENKSQYWPRGANKHVDTAEIEPTDGWTGGQRNGQTNPLIEVLINT